MSEKLNQFNPEISPVPENNFVSEGGERDGFEDKELSSDSTTLTNSLRFPGLDDEVNNFIDLKSKESGLIREKFDILEAEKKEALAKKNNKRVNEIIAMQLLMARKMEKLLIEIKKAKENNSLHRPDISVGYQKPDGSKEIIELNIDRELEDFQNFYEEAKLETPPDFNEFITDIWERNKADIEQAIEENGFDGMLLIPGNIPLPELADKMKMGNGIYESDNFKNNGSFAGASSQGVDRPRIILYHKEETLSEIQEKTGLDVHLNITGAKVKELYEKNPDHYLATLEDFLILERKYSEDTGKKLSDCTNNSANWLPGTKAGARHVFSDWDPDVRGLFVFADSPENQCGSLGVRPSRCFF